ncbi:hypothetical protein U1839_13025 [Sphingomonas sp. RT2P30]|uniref:CC_3452 family protein n=1 Tax=Parasphingomonas halimpatiens TaxID=3096162 RepID=UPI002FC5C885
MIRSTALIAAAIATAALLSPIAANAQGPAGFYAATPATQPTNATIITNATLWTLHDATYTANRAPERPNILCELVVKRVGKLTSFSAGGQAFDDAALAKCNARAK